MDLLLSFDKNGFANAESELQNVAETYLQEIVEKFNNLKIGKLDQASFIKLFTSPIEVVFNKITGGSLAINDVAISKEKAMELIEKPIGYNQFIEKIKSTVTYLQDKRIPKLNIPIAPKICDVYLLNENEEVVLNDEFLQILQRRFKKYATSDNAKKMYSLANFIIEKYNELGIDKIATSGDSIGVAINQILTKEFNKPLKLNEEGILKFNYG